MITSIKTRTILLIIAFICFACVAVMAQGPGFPGGDVDDVPIDGGVSLIAAATIGYGIKKIRQKNSEK